MFEIPTNLRTRIYLLFRNNARHAHKQYEVLPTNIIRVVATITVLTHTITES